MAKHTPSEPHKVIPPSAHDHEEMLKSDNMVLRENYKATLRPDNYEQLSPREQWEVDKELGILDWDGEPSYTQEVQELADFYKIEFSVALDVHYLFSLCDDIIECAQANSELRDFPVNHPELESFIVNHMKPKDGT